MLSYSALLYITFSVDLFRGESSEGARPVQLWRESMLMSVSSNPVLCHM